MARIVIVAAFLATFFVALVVFLSRDRTSHREKMEQAGHQDRPRVLLSQFRARRYHGTQQLAEVSAVEGSFRAPNIVRLDGEVRSWQLRDDGRQEMRSEAAIALFSSENLVDLMHDAELDQVYLRRFVRMSLRDHLLTTESAHYAAREELVTGSEPVRVEGPGRWFSGRGGFRLDLVREEWDVYGTVKGMVESPGSTDGASD